MFRLDKFVSKKSGKRGSNIVYIDDKIKETKKEKETEEKVRKETEEDELLSLSTDQLFMLLGKLQYEVVEMKYKIKRIHSILYDKKT